MRLLLRRPWKRAPICFLDKNPSVDALTASRMRSVVWSPVSVELTKSCGEEPKLRKGVRLVLSTIHEKADYGGKPVEFRGRRTAVWVRQDKRWVCVTIHASAFPPK